MKGIKRRSIPILLLVLAYSTAIIVVGVHRSAGLDETSDFHGVFWNSGRNFSSGEPLYEPRIHGFLNNPPLGAFISLPFHWLPLRTSALVWFLINGLLMPPLVIGLLWRILDHVGVDTKKRWIILLLSVFVSVGFFWNNLIMFNINYFLFFFILLGIHFLLRDKQKGSIAIFTILGFVKLLPIALAFYVLFFRFSKRVLLSFFFTILLCLALPALIRGPDRWVEDHREYFREVLTPYVKEGRICATATNHSLKAAYAKALHPEARENANVYPADYQGLARLIYLSQLVLLGMLAARGIVLLRRGSRFSLSFLSSLLLFMHLYSGLTWSAHLVTMSFCILPFLLIDPGKLTYAGKTFWFSFLFIILALSLEGSDTFGRSVYSAVRYWDVYTLLMLLLFGFNFWLMIRKNPEHVLRDGLDATLI
ncbi:MAG: glycosyltransferase family 87 protein [Bacteroidales bacterium]